LEETDRSMKRMQKKLREEELQQLRGEMDTGPRGDRQTDAHAKGSGADKGRAAVPKAKGGDKGRAAGRGSAVEGGASEESSDMSDDLSHDSRTESEEVSLASSASNSLIEDDEEGSGSEISGSADFEGDDANYRSEGDDSEDNF
jgi:hypothetical protein